jgi:carboxypeptidase C (cathepsin A)
MAQKACTKCGIVKPYEQFSKNKAARDGYQFHCKECNNKDNYRFRHEIDPTYMNRWFDKNKQHWQTYMNDYSRVGNTNTIYSITAPNGDVYIGFTQRKKRFRLSEHKKFYKAKTKNKVPLLWESFDRYGIDNHQFDILKQFEGTRSEGMEIESKLIQFYKSINKSLNVKD